MSNPGRILTTGERDRAHMSQLETENADLEWKRMAAEANAQISIAGQANWRSRAIAAEARVKALEEALTPSGDTKAEYSSEISFRICDGYDDYGDPTTRDVTVPWTAVKGIMKMIRARAAISQQGGE